MNKDEIFKLAVQLVSGNLSHDLLSPKGTRHVSAALCNAYNAVIDAYGKIPPTGPVKID